MIKSLIDELLLQLKLIYSTKAQSLDGKRITYIDMARGFAIILVVMGHRGFITATTNTWISTFHLPLFFIASGIFLFAGIKDKNTSFMSFLIVKLKSLILPYFAFSIIAVLLDFHFKPAGAENLMPLFKIHLLQTVLFQGYSVLWFLPVTFLAEIILYLLAKKLDVKKLTIVMLILSFAGYYAYGLLAKAGIFGIANITFDNTASEYVDILQGIFKLIFKSFIAASFMCFGHYLFLLFEKMKNRIVGLIAGIVLFAVNVISVNFINLKDLNNLDLGFISVYYLLGLTGSAAVFLICKNGINISLLTFFGKNSLIVFVTHLNCYVLYYGTIFYMHFYKHYHLPDIVNENITANVYTMIFTFLLEIPVIVLINVFLPFLIGKGYKKLKV